MPDVNNFIKRFLIADDHSIVRTGLTLLLKRLYANSIVEESETGDDVISKLKQNSYDFIIMDMQMPNTDALELIKNIKTNYPSLPVLIHSMLPEHLYAVKVLAAGAKGFVSKETSIDELTRAIQLTNAGGTYISSLIAASLSTQNSKISTSPFANLSGRELQVVSFLITGKTVTEISKILGLKNSTVGTHKGNLYRKLKVTNLLELKLLSDLYKL